MEQCTSTDRGKLNLTNIPECAIIGLYIKNPFIYNNYNNLNISYLKDSYPELAKILNTVKLFRLRYPDNSSTEDFHAFYLASHNLSSKERDAFEAVYEQIASSESSKEVILDLLKEANRRAILQQLAIASFESIDDCTRELDVVKLYESLKQDTISSTTEDTFVTCDLEELYEQQVKTRGLRWRLESLNRSLGSLRVGDFGFVFARPETGKTTFLASEVSYMAGQTTQPILWFNNEEQGAKVMLRIYQAALGFPLEQLLSSIKRNKADFLRLTSGNIRLLDGAYLTKDIVTRNCEALKPSLIIFDQIDKIGGFDADRKDLELGEIYIWARELAKTYAPVIGVCQADGSGEGSKWLTMANVSNAKTSKQAEADWILGIGKQNESGMEYVRHFHVSKNKLFGDEDSDPNMRHGKWDVKIQPTIARYEDYLK